MGAVETEDECTFLAVFENGAHGFFRASRVRSEQRLLVAGSEGDLRWHLDGDRLEMRTAKQTQYDAIERPELAEQVTFVDPFVRGIQSSKELGPSFYDGAQAQEVIDAVLTSAERGEWIRLPLAG
jgi:predicted dehydrogenase